jgi:cell division protein FtsQ
MRRNAYKRPGASVVRRALKRTESLGRRAWQPMVLLLAVVVLFEVMTDLLRSSSHFLVRRVDVHETQRVTREQILDLTKLNLPMNSLMFDARVAEEALEEHPWIASAGIEVRLPSSVSIHLTERVPSAVVTLGHLYVVDGSGEPFVRASPEDVQNLPLVTGLDRAMYEEHPELSRSWIRNALSLGRLYGQSALAETRPLGNMNIGLGGELELMVGHTRIVMGTDLFPLKLDRLERIYADLGARKSDAAWILLDEKGERAIVRESAAKRPMMGSL